MCDCQTHLHHVISSPAKPAASGVYARHLVPALLYPQGLSPLFKKLSAEVRNMIFDYALTLEPVTLRKEDLDPITDEYEYPNPYPRYLYTENIKPLHNKPLAIKLNGSRKMAAHHNHLALLQTCRRIYIETHLTPLQLGSLTYKITNVFCRDLICNNDRLLWMFQWQRSNLRKVHVHGLLRGPARKRFIASLNPAINSLSLRLESMSLLCISTWASLSDSHQGIMIPTKFDTDLALLCLAELPINYPTLREVVVEFGAAADDSEMLDRVVNELATKEFNTLEGHTLVVDPQSVQDRGWITKYNGVTPPQGMISRGLRWFTKEGGRV